MREEIQTDDAPEPIGPYSQGIKSGGMVYVSGQGPADPETREILVDGIRDQTAQAIDNAESVLEAGGVSLEDVVRATVYLSDMNDYDGMNRIFRQRLPEPYPARAAMEMGELPGPFLVEISMIAHVPGDK
jgi:2-iminobutanoate/2-iminopropanoate deaminase